MHIRRKEGRKSALRKHHQYVCVHVPIFISLSNKGPVKCMSTHSFANEVLKSIFFAVDVPVVIHIQKERNNIIITFALDAMR